MSVIHPPVWTGEVRDAADEAVMQKIAGLSPDTVAACTSLPVSVRKMAESDGWQQGLHDYVMGELAFESGNLKAGFYNLVSRNATHVKTDLMKAGCRSALLHDGMGDYVAHIESRVGSGASLGDIALEATARNAQAIDAQTAVHHVTAPVPADIQTADDARDSGAKPWGSRVLDSIQTVLTKQ